MIVNTQTQVSALSSRPSSLSEDTIPSVKGEWYNYHPAFTPFRPLGYLMKCKSNKDRPLSFIEQNEDVDLVFFFGPEGVQICSPDSELSIALLEDQLVSAEALKKTSIARVDLTEDQFVAIRNTKDRDGLVTACGMGVVTDQLVVTVGAVIAVSTPAGKYGLMRVVEVGPEAVRFDACHVLL